MPSPGGNCHPARRRPASRSVVLGRRRRRPGTAPGAIGGCRGSSLTRVGPDGPGDTGRAFRPPRSGTRRARALPHPLTSACDDPFICFSDHLVAGRCWRRSPAGRYWSTDRRPNDAQGSSRAGAWSPGGVVQKPPTGRRRRGRPPRLWLVTDPCRPPPERPGSRSWPQPATHHRFSSSLWAGARFESSTPSSPRSRWPRRRRPPRTRGTARRSLPAEHIGVSC
jgi:hypothetical protein